MTFYRFAEVPSITRESIEVEVEARDRLGGRRVNLASTGVYFAFVAEDAEPRENDWKPGSWEVLNGTYLARFLVGGDGVPLDPGDWVVWIRVVSNPEQPARPLGILRVT